MEENQVIETPAVAEVSEMSEPTMAGFTAEDLAKARAQEKQKLYPQMEKMQEELAKAKALAEELAAKDSQREAERAAKKAERDAKKKQEEEQELSFKELLSKKEQEFASQLEAERLEREKAFALLERERQFQDLMNYRGQRIEEERDTIVPQLIDLVNGNTQEEIEQSIATLKDKSAAIMQDVQQATANAKQSMVGARVTAPASGPLDNDSEQKSYTPDSIRDMSLADYAKQRAKLLGTAASNRGQGLFG
jgi:DNA repair exonuclease SbcCD ATPase subunit